jgi:hypothetical protein
VTDLRALRVRDRIWDMIIHHEDYNISVNLSTHWASDATERW